MAVIVPNGPYEMQKTLPSPSLPRLSLSPGPRDSPSLAGHGPETDGMLRGEGPRVYEMPARGTGSGPRGREHTAWPANEGLSPGAGGPGSLIRKNLGEFSVFCKLRSELVRPILDLLDPDQNALVGFISEISAL